METRPSAAPWAAVAEEVFTGMQEWRTQHPRATFAEIEVALDERLGRLRARMLEDAALASAAAELSPDQPRPPCPQCGGALQVAGRHPRRLSTSHQQTLTLTRAYARCPACGTGLFPPG